MTDVVPTSAHSVRVEPDHPVIGPGPPGRVLVVVGAGCVVLGGLVAALTGPLRLAQGSWLAAYLVLVCGISQYAMGRVPALVAAAPTPDRCGWTQLGCWNLGNAAVVVGTLLALPAVVDLGAAFLAAGLTIAWLVVRRTDTASKRSRAARATVWVYRGWLLLLLVSLPVGMLLAQLRHG